MAWNFAERLFAYEQGELEEEETLQLFQELVDSGMILELQGSHQRTAQAYIDAGLINPPGSTQEIGEEISCPICDSYNVTQTAAKPMDGKAEYLCEDCGEYFIARQGGPR